MQNRKYLLLEASWLHEVDNTVRFTVLELANTVFAYDTDKNTKGYKKKSRFSYVFHSDVAKHLSI